MRFLGFDFSGLQKFKTINLPLLRVPLSEIEKDLPKNICKIAQESREITFTLLSTFPTCPAHHRSRDAAHRMGRHFPNSCHKHDKTWT